MIDRVAAAICCPGGCVAVSNPELKESDCELCDAHRSMARAAIEAMRVPIREYFDEMLQGDNACWETFDDWLESEMLQLKGKDNDRT